MPETDVEAERRLSKRTPKVVVYTPLVTVSALPVTEPLIGWLKVLLPVKVLLSESAEDDAALIVISDVPLNDTPLIFLAFCSAVAVPAFPEIEPVIVAEKMLAPLHVLLLTRSVEDAAVTVMSEVPLNETPLIKREFWRAVAVPALPETEPVTVCEKVFAPPKVLLSLRSDDDAALTEMEVPILKLVPLTVPSEPSR